MSYLKHKPGSLEESVIKTLQEGNWQIYADGAYKHTGGGNDDKFDFLKS